MANLKKSKGLGRGLDALLGPRNDQPFQQGDDQAGTTDAPTVLPIDRVVTGAYQPRSQMDEGALYELAESIKAQGVLQPVLVRALNGGPNQGKYEILAGERRFRAASLAGLNEIPVLVRNVSDEAAAAIGLIENIQREDLNPLEQAQGLQRLVGEFGHTHEQAAQAVGRSRSATSNLLRLLQLTEPVQTMLKAGDLEMGHARALLALKHAQQIVAANQIASKKMTVREAETLVKKLGAESNSASTRTHKPEKEKSNDLRRLEEALSDLLAADVQIHVKKRIRRGGRMQETGEVAIRFASLEELNGLIERLSPGVAR